jgi:ATP-binding cassette, subfamily B, bacterial PglK
MKFILRFLGFRRALLLSLFLLTLIFLDLVGIAMLLPFVTVFQKSNLEVVSYLEKTFLNSLIQIDIIRHNATLLLLLTMVLVYLLKYLLSVVIVKRQHDIISRLTRDLSRVMYNRILNVSYSTFQRHPASQLMGVVFNNPMHASLFLVAIATVFSDLAFLIVVFSVSLLLNPEITSVLALMMIASGAALYLFFVPKVQRIGKEQSQMEIKQHKLSFATISAIKDIKIMGVESLFLQEHLNISEQFFYSTKRYGSLNSILRFSVEAIMFIAIIMLAYVSSKQSFNSSTLPYVVVMLGLFMRLLPSFNRIISAIQNIKYYTPFLEKLNNFFCETEPVHVIKHEINTPTFFELRLIDLSFKYGERVILDKINLSIKKGELLGIVGKSGTGKSTLLDILSGLQKCSSGEIILNEEIIDPYGSDILRSLIGYVPQNVTLLDDSIRFNITFEREFDNERLEYAIKAANLARYISGLPNGVLTQVGENGINVSGGQRQRIGIARALYRNPEILIFDESTSALDNVTEKELTMEIESLGKTKTIIIVAHRISTIKKCDTIIVLEEGSIVGQGSYSDLVHTCDSFRSLSVDN